MINLNKLKLEKFAKGHRSTVYVGFYKNKKIAVKIGMRVVGRVSNEAIWLKILNKYDIGPKLLFSGKDCIVYEFVEGERFVDWLRNNFGINKVLKEIFRQLRILDKLKVNKEEMHHPIKHILVGEKVVMIDFERCNKVDKPKNITQFCKFLFSKNIENILKDRGINIDREKLIEILKEYKKEQNEKNFKRILKIVLT